MLVGLKGSDADAACLSSPDGELHFSNYNILDMTNIYSNITHSKIDKLFSSLRSKSIAIIGDFCLDAYWIIDPLGSEISLETGLSTRAVKLQRYAPGGAGNVANNLKKLGFGSVTVYGVIGNDPFGIELKSQLEKVGCKTTNLIIQSTSWDTPTYGKPIQNSKEEARIDFGSFNLLSKAIAEELVIKLENEIKDYDMVVINQQLNNGLHQQSFPFMLQELINKYDQISFISDCRDLDISYSMVHCKINKIEALNKGLINIVDSKISPDMDKIKMENYNNLFISKGDEGCLIVEELNIYDAPIPQRINKVDSVGAGDSMLSGLAAGLCCGWDALNSALMGNLVASITVQKQLQTGTASSKDIFMILEEIVKK